MTDLDSMELKQNTDNEEIIMRIRAYAGFHLDLRTPKTSITIFRKVLSILRTKANFIIPSLGVSK